MATWRVADRGQGRASIWPSPAAIVAFPDSPTHLASRRSAARQCAAALASLCPENFRLDAETPTVVLAVRNDKSRKGKTQPLPSDLASALRPYIDSRPASRPVWGDAWVKDGAEMLRGDLEAAGIPYVVEGTDGPLYADFHALRHSFITALSKGGVDLRTAQELAGHSTPVLTARYSHPRLYDLAGAVEKMPGFLPTRAGVADTEVLPLRATGTSGTDFGCSMVAQPAVTPGHLKATSGTEQGGNAKGAALPQPIATSSFRITSHPLTSEGIERPLPDLNRGMTDLQSVAFPLG